MTSLKALAEAKTDGINKLTIFTIDPDVVVIEEGWNGRDENDDLREYRQRLKAAMKAGAFIPPIDVEMVDDAPTLRDGHSRTLMARELKAEGTPYTLQARQIRGNDAEMVYHMIGSGLGRHLTPLEQGRQLLRLTRFGETVVQIAARLGQSRSTIENGLALAEMPAAVQKAVGAGKIASHLALKTVKTHGKEASKVIAAAVKDAESKGKRKATPKAVKAVAGPAPTPAERIWIGTAHLAVADVAAMLLRVGQLQMPIAEHTEGVSAVVIDVRRMLGI